jgi:tetratricopeptide (TPR) repeat protein
MTRTSMYKSTYFGMLVLGVALSLWIVFYFQMTVVGVLILAVILLFPGRVLGFFWRDLLRGLRLLHEKRYAESKRHSELFLTKVKDQPWLKKLIWLGSGAYSRDPEAMALNNLGAAELKLGELDDAKAHLAASIAVDELNPLPYFNMGLLYSALGDRDAATGCFDKAVSLGYSRSAVDRFFQNSQKHFAESDGQGSSLG